MNIFKEIMRDQAKEERSLGNPLRDPAAIERRLNVMALMTGGKGFGTPPKSLRVDGQGRTRGERKRALRQAANEKETARVIAVAEARQRFADSFNALRGF